jgi:hypothetical protein
MVLLDDPSIVNFRCQGVLAPITQHCTQIGNELDTLGLSRKPMPILT